jgi:hypothetical protein
LKNTICNLFHALIHSGPKNSLLTLLVIGMIMISCKAQESLAEFDGADKTLAEIQQDRMAQKVTNAGIAPTFEKGKISPVYMVSDPKELEKVSGVYYVTGRYYLDSIAVDQTIDAPPLIDDIGGLLANILIKIGGNIELDMDPLPIDLSDIDFEIVKDIRVKRIHVKIKDNPSGKANLKFLREIKVLLGAHEETNQKSTTVITPHKGSLTSEETPVDEKREYHQDLTGNENTSHQQVVLLNFNKKEELHKSNSTACDWQCIDFEVTNANLIKLIKNKSEIYVRPKVKIGSIAKESFVLGGFVEFSLGLKLDL